MVVAAGAADRQAEHRRAGGGQHVVELVVALLFDLVGGDLRGVTPPAEKARGHQRQRVFDSGSISSPASCQRTNVSYGMSWLSALMTKSR